MSRLFLATRVPARSVAVYALAFLCFACADRGPSAIRVASTPMIVEIGLASALFDAFQTAHPQYRIAPLPASEGAFETARKREADVLFTNSPTEEARLIAEEHALDRRPVMHSEFVLVGPPEDPADVAGISDIGDAFRAIAGAGMRFVESSGGPGATRPDQAIWASIGVTPAAPWAMSGEASPADGLRLASDQRAYLLVDLASFLAVAPTVDLEIVSQGDRRLVDAHAVLLVANASNARGARAFAEWLAGPAARSVIEEFALDPFGAPVFRAGPAPVGPR